jgi:carbon monoxide dehydrogenase subunit G
MQLQTAFSAALVVALIASACDKIRPTQPELQSHTEVPVSPLNQEASPQVLANNTQRELDEMAIAIAELRSRASAANATSRVALTAEVERLELEWNEVHKRLSTLRRDVATSRKTAP